MFGSSDWSLEVKFVCYCLLEEDRCSGRLCLVLRSAICYREVGYGKRLGDVLDVLGWVGVSYRVGIYFSVVVLLG